jgi:aryl-alcohol dehydrogenase-like predicted oxidoreductase
VAAPIASATSAKQLEELVGFARLHLRPDTVAALDAASVGGEQPPAW